MQRSGCSGSGSGQPGSRSGTSARPQEAVIAARKPRHRQSSPVLASLARLQVPEAGGRRAQKRYAAVERASLRVATVVKVLVVVVPIVLVAYVVAQLVRPVPDPTAGPPRTTFAVAGSHLSLPWPSQGASALAVQGTGLVGTAGSASPVPIASITKVMTAMVVLAHHPLTVGQSGPAISITAADVTQYQADLAGRQSVLAVSAGEQLSELQALEGLLVPSANNIAQILATWDSGSVPAFVAAMNAKAAALGLHHTHFAGPSGLNPASVATAADVVRLGEAAMANPVFASVVSMAQVTLPGAGTVYNFNDELGRDGFIGIKTGSDGPAGGCFLFDATVTTGATSTHLVGAVLGIQTTPILQGAINAGVALVNAMRPEVHPRQLVAAGEHVVEISSPWGRDAPAVAGRSVTVEAWPGLALHGTISLRPLKPGLRSGQQIGVLTLAGGGSTRRVPLMLGGAIPRPGDRWKLTRL